MRGTPQSRLHLLIPGLFGPIKGLAELGVPVRVPVLETLLSRADKSRFEGGDLPACLFHLFGYPQASDRDLPEGAVNLLGQGSDPGEACWMRADPVHLLPDRDRLLLFDSGMLNLTLQEAEELATDFNVHFSQEGLELVVVSAERWYLRLEQCSRMTTSPLGAVAGRHIETFLPLGADAARWRRLSNEMQMLLHQSRVNQRRETLGQPAVNGIWPAGIGRLPEIDPARFVKAFTHDPMARGLAMLAGVPVVPIPNSLEDICDGDEELLLLFDELLLPVQRADPLQWLDQLQRLNRRMDGLMRTKDWLEIKIYSCDGWVYRVTRSGLKRFWRSRRKFINWVEIG